MSPSQRLLVICTGNVCRSPYLQRRLDLALDGTGIEVASAGTGALAGHPMDERMAAQLGEQADPDFAARDVTADLVVGSDLVLTATRAHRTAVTRLAPKALRRTFVVADFAQLCDTLTDVEVQALAGRPLAHRVVAVSRCRSRVAPLPAERADIVDPFNLADGVYQAAAAQIDGLVPSLLRALR